MTTKETKSDRSTVLSSAQFDACRADFVSFIKMENFYREPWARTSIKGHWSGSQGGFANDGLQARWLDYKSGWMAGRASNKT